MPAAPIDAQYLTLAANGELTDYRIFQVGSMLVAVDSGPAQPFTLDVDPTQIDHADLDQLTAGNPHTQYLLGTLFSANGQLLTRIAGSPAALAVGAAGQVLTVAGGLPSWATPAAAYTLLNSSPAEVVIVNTNALQTLYTFAIPGGTLASGDLLRLRLACDYLNNSAASRTLTLKVTLQGTVSYQSTSASITVAAGRHGMPIELTFHVRNASPNVRTQAIIGLSSPTAPTTGIGNLSTSTFDFYPTGDSDVTLSSSCTLLVEVQHSATHASLELRMRGATLELTKA